MATQYFRITAYCPVRDISFIMDTIGMYEKIWQFSSFMLQKGFQVLEVSSDEKFIDGNIVKEKPDPDNFIMRARCKGRPGNIVYEYKDIVYEAIRVGNKIYIPDKEKVRYGKND